MKSDENKRYKKIKDVGEGGYGKILLIEDYKDHQTYALKKMKVDVFL